MNTIYMKNLPLYTDCQNFPLDRPCTYHKESGIHCRECRRYVPLAAPSKTVRKILIIKLGAMGDVLRTTFLLEGLKEKYPRAEITWIVAPQSTAVLEGNPRIGRIWPMEKDVISKLALEKFDVAVNMDLSPESLGLATLANAGKRIGYWLDGRRGVKASNAAARQWLGMSAFDDLKKKNTQTYQRWMSRIAELPRADYEIYVPLKRSSLAKARAFAAKHRLSGKTVIGINPGAGKRWKLKKWTDAGFKAIIRRCEQEGFAVLLLGGPEEKELLAKLAKTSRAVVNAGTDNALPDFFALVNLCDLLITGDTMAMHAALGLKKKVVSIFGPTSAPEIELYGRGAKIVSPAPCVCCYRMKCNVKPDCMQRIKPDAVWNGVQRLLKA